MNMKIYPSVKKTLIYFSVVAIILLFFLYLSLGHPFQFPFLTIDYIVFGAWLIMTTIFLIITIKCGYYIIDKKCIYQKRLTKTYCYQYNDIIYIDEKWSRKNKILFFVTNRGDSIYLVLDKNQILLDEVLKKCKNLKSKEEVRFQFPNLKL